MGNQLNSVLATISTRVVYQHELKFKKKPDLVAELMALPKNHAADVTDDQQRSTSSLVVGINSFSRPDPTESRVATSELWNLGEDDILTGEGSCYRGTGFHVAMASHAWKGQETIDRGHTDLQTN